MGCKEIHWFTQSLLLVSLCTNRYCKESNVASFQIKIYPKLLSLWKGFSDISINSMDSFLGQSHKGVEDSFRYHVTTWLVCGADWVILQQYQCHFTTPLSFILSSRVHQLQYKISFRINSQMYIKNIYYSKLKVTLWNLNFLFIYHI